MIISCTNRIIFAYANWLKTKIRIDNDIDINVPQFSGKVKKGISQRVSTLKIIK